MLHAPHAAKLGLVGRLLPRFLAGRDALLCDKDGESKPLLSTCFPVCLTLSGEREEGKNHCSVLFEKGCLKDQGREGELLPLS